jgi:phosphotransferase system enzyme I (PtsI)
MITLKGKGAHGGVAIGRAVFFRRADISVERRSVADVEGELKRFRAAKERTAKELRALYERALSDIGQSGAQIFEIHEMMLFDEDYNHLAENTIRVENVNAEYAVSVAADHFAKIFSSMGDPYMSARAVDVREVSRRLCRVLSGAEDTNVSGKGIILCADDLAPGETMQLDKKSILAFVTSEGSVNSHTAILARTMGIPAVVGVGEKLAAISDGTLLAVDSFCGEVYSDPDGETLSRLEKKRNEQIRAEELLEKYRGLDNVTLDGTRIDVFANIQSISEVGAAIKSDAGGIGLFRSEFLYIGRDMPPDENEQFGAYRTVLSSMGNKKVIIRTLDIGADKQAPFLDLPREENPALGMRGIRICLTNEAVFRTQLRALFRASVFGRLCIMFPMITSVSEVDAILTLCRRIKSELLDEGHRVSEDIELGIMIETPAAVMISDKLAALVDFFSIGTNDLGQYTLAIDRQNRNADRFFDPHHEAILRMIGIAADNAHKNGKWVGICGELGADLSLTETFLRMGIDELSVSPSCILSLRDKIRNIDLRKGNSKE